MKFRYLWSDICEANQSNTDKQLDPVPTRVVWRATDKATIPQQQILMVLNDLLKMNWSDHVLMNSNALVSNPSDNVTYGTRQWSRPMWGKNPQIRINKGLATDPIDAIILRSTIHGLIVNSYFTQVKTGKNTLTKDPFQMQIQITTITWSVR